MKCDNLQRFKYSIWVFKGKGKHETAVDGYNADEVDEAIAELKDKITKLEQEIKYKDGVCKRWFDRCMEARTILIMITHALWHARYERASAEAMLKSIECGLGDDTYIRWKNAEKALERKLKELKNEVR